jgi:hypothetical protein
MNLFLRAKHWQIFLLTFVLPLLAEFIMIGYMMGNIINNAEHNSAPDLGSIFSFFRIFPAMIIISSGILFGWMFSIAIGLQKMLPPAIKMKTTLFKIFLFFPVVYIALFCLFFAFSLGSLMHVQDGGGPPRLLFAGFAVIFPLHLFAMFCIFYSINFVAKTMKTAELQRPVTFSDYVAEFFLVWFHFVGVWILQPRINKMLKNYENGAAQAPDNRSVN